MNMWWTLAVPPVMLGYIWMALAFGRWLGQGTARTIEREAAKGAQWAMDRTPSEWVKS